jgi:hypothetical protein
MRICGGIVKKDPEKNYNNLQKVMARLFKNFPPQQNSRARE